MLARTPPWKHQEDALAASLPHDNFALFMEMRTGKSLVIIETALQLYSQHKVSGMLIIAPNGVHENWVQEPDGELATHWPSSMGSYQALAWKSSTSKKYLGQFEALLKVQGFAVLAMNYEALATIKGFTAAQRFLKHRRCLLVTDESDRIKNPHAACSKALFKLGPLAPYRRILTGTPLTQSPLDIWAQFQLMQPGILNPSFTAFRTRYQKLLPQTHPFIVSLMRKKGLRFVPAIPEVDEFGQPRYQHLEELQQIVAKHSFRVLRTDCKDMPPKNYQKLLVPLEGLQAQLYDQMRTQFYIELAGIERVEAPLVITRMLRLQQIIGGFAEDQSLFADGQNPRVNALLDSIDGVSGKVIIWARFVPELLAIHAALAKRYGINSTALYYGGTPGADRLEARQRFLDTKDPLRFMVGQPGSGGVGVPMHSADTVYYYSNEFKLRTRLQSEDRAQHMNKETPVEYVDLISPDTIDVKIVEALRAKHEVARLVTGDKWKQWI